jgi:hypothetical protein
MAYTLAPDARRPIKDPTLARLPPERAEPIDNAPRQPDTSILLFCPEQGGWQVGEWWTVDRPRWVAVLDAAIEPCGIAARLRPARLKKRALLSGTINAIAIFAGLLVGLLV